MRQELTNKEKEMAEAINPIIAAVDKAISELSPEDLLKVMAQADQVLRVRYDIELSYQYKTLCAVHKLLATRSAETKWKQTLKDIQGGGSLEDAPKLF